MSFVLALEFPWRGEVKPARVAHRAGSALQETDGVDSWKEETEVSEDLRGQYVLETEKPPAVHGPRFFRIVEPLQGSARKPRWIRGFPLVTHGYSN